MKNNPLFLLADDDEDDRMLFQDALAEINAGIRCLMATNGKEALYILDNRYAELPDFIILDVNMPVMDGLKCLSEIKKATRLQHIPVILYSTSSERKFIEEGLKSGALDFFVKPNNFGGLIKYITNLIS